MILEGIIDIGSNTIRLCVYEFDFKRPKQFRRIFNEKKSVGLAAYVDNGVMSDAGVRAASKAIAHHLQHARLLGCDEIRAFATAALRNCVNSAEAMRAIEEKTGARIELIAAQQEAELGFLGMQIDSDINEGLVVDIGGGSTELSRIEGGAVRQCCSIPTGSLSLWKSCVAGILPSAGEFEACQKAFHEALERSGFSMGTAGRIYGTGGTIRNAAKMAARLSAGSASTTDSAAARSESMITSVWTDELAELVVADPLLFSRTLLSIEPARIHTLAPGLAVLQGIFELSGAQDARISKYGVREGYLLNIRPD